MSLPPPIKKRARRGRQRRLARIAAETSAVSVHLSEIDSMEEGEIELNGSGAAETGRPEATPREKSPHHFSANGFGEVEPNRVCQVGQQTWYNAAPSQDFAINWAHDGAQKSAPTMPSGGRGYRRDPLEQPGTLAELQPQTRYQPQPQTRYRHHTESQFQPHPENWFQPQPGPQARFQLQPQMGSQPQPQTRFQPQSGPWSTPQQSSENWYPPAGSGDCGDRDRGVRDDRCTYGDARNYFVRDGDDGGRGEGTGGGDGGDSASVENMRRSKSMSRGNRSAPSQVQDDLDRSAAFDRDATGWSNGHEEGSQWWFEPKETQQLCEWPSPAAAVGFDGDTAVHRNTAALGSTVGSVADGVDGREKRDTFLNNSRHCRVGAPRSGFHDDLEIPEGDRRRSERTSSQSNSGMFGAAHAANRLGEKSYGTDARESGGDRIGRIDLPMRPFSPEADVDLRENAGTCGRTNFLVSGKASEERTHGNYHQPERDSWQQPQFDPWKQSGKWPRSYDDAATSVDVSIAGSSRATEGLTDEVSASPFVAAAATVGDSGRFPAPTGANCEWSHEAGFQRYSGQPLQHVAPTSWDAGGVNIEALGLPSESVVVGDNTRVPVGETQMAAAKAVAKAPPGRSAEDLEREEQLWKRLQMPRKSKPQLPLQPQPPPPPPPPPPLPPPQWLPPQPLLHPPQLLKPPQTLQPPQPLPQLPPQPLLQLPPQPLLQLPPQPPLPKPTPLPPQQLTPQPPLPKPTPLQPSQPPPPPQPPLQSSQLRADEPPQPQRAGHPSSQVASGRAQPLVVASLNAPVHDAGVDTAAADRFVYSNKDSALSSTRVVEAATRKVSEQTTGEHDAQRKRAARRNWRSASQNFALVLVGVANLPRKVCSKVAKIPSAIWVDRHELADPSSLPLEVKATLAKVLAERMLPCGSCDQSESGRDHLLLMTFTSLDAKEIAVRNLAELGVDTADFDNSRCVQVEQASALCFKPSSSPLPPQQQTAPKPGAQTPPAITIKSRKDPNPKAESKVARTKAEAKDAASKASLSSRVKQAREKALKGLQIERRIAAEAKAKAAEAKAAEAEAKVKAAGLETEAKAAELEAKAKAEAAEAEAKVKSLESEAKAKVAEVNAKADTKRNAAASARVSDTTGASSQAMGSDEARGARRSESTHGDHSLGVTRPAKARAHNESGAPAKAASSDEARDDRRLESMRGDRPALVKRSADVVAKARASYGSGSLPKAAGAEETWGTSESKHNGRLVGVKWPAAAPAAGQALDIAPQSAAKRARVQLPRSGTTGDGIESKEENSGQAKDFKAALKTVKSGRSGTAAEVARVQVQAIPAASTGPSKAAETTSKTSALPRPVRPETSESEKYIAASMPATSVAVSAAAAAMPRDARITETSAKRASLSPVRQERRTPSPPVPHATSRKVGVGQAGARAAAPGPRALSPPRYHAVRGVGLVKPTNGAGNAERVLPPLKALNKRLVVTRPSRLPDPTIQHWHYGFSGKYFKLQDRDPKTGEALPSCDPSKNSSYVGVIPSTEVLLEGLREHVKQRRAAEAAAAGTTGAASVAAPAPTPAAHAATVSTGAPNITRRKTSALSSTDTEDHRTGALTARVAPPIRRKMPSPSLAGNMAFQNERKAAEKGGKGSVREVYRGGGAVAVSSAGRGETEKVGEGKSRSRIREAEEELRSLQEIKIPRVTKALADVSKQRRKIEAVVTSIAAKTAAAHARLAQDSRDAASALMEELRAKREFSQRQRHQKKQQQQQHRDSQTHGGKATGGISAGVKVAVPTKLSQAQSFSGSSKSGRPDIPERS